jgi:hypothetical protein
MGHPQYGRHKLETNPDIFTFRFLLFGPRITSLAEQASPPFQDTLNEVNCVSPKSAGQPGWRNMNVTSTSGKNSFPID